MNNKKQKEQKLAFGNKIIANCCNCDDSDDALWNFPGEYNKCLRCGKFCKKRTLILNEYTNEWEEK